jgi:cysteine desulfuration protein SufE
MTHPRLNIDELADNFSLFDDWEDRYRYIIDLGRALDPLPDENRIKDYKVDGCISQVWLLPCHEYKDGKVFLSFIGDSDAHIVKGLLAIIFSLFSHKTPEEILEIDADAQLARLDLDQHISPNRRNGVASVIQVIRAAARSHLNPTT